MSQTRTLPISQIHPNPHQPRKHFEPQALQELARSIQQQGVLQPLIVRPHPQLVGQFELVAGERRWRALQLAEISEAPVLVRMLSDREALEVALLENIQREDLTPIEEARCYQELMQHHGYTQEELAQRLGRDRSTIANLVRLLLLPPALQQDIERGRLSAGHARALLALPKPSLQLKLREQLLRKNWSVRETERQVRLALEEDQSTQIIPWQEAPIPDAEQAQLRLLEEDLQRQLGTKVRLDAKASGRGEIRLSYFSAEDLERLLQVLRPRR